MRENMGLYRGKRIDGHRDNTKNGTMLYGSLFIDKNGQPKIKWYCEKHGSAMTSNVDPETVGQYIGLTDMTGKKIFEGDIIKIRFESDSFTHPAEPIVWYTLAKVFWSSEQFGWYAAFASGEELSMWEYDDPDDVEIVGNIHDNPELLEVK